MSAALLKVVDLRVEFGRQVVVRGVSFEVGVGETVGLVGESGAGKSSIARAVLRLQPATGGRVEWRGEDVFEYTPAEMRSRRRDMQIVFQDPLASLDPRMTVGRTIAEPLENFEPHLGGAARLSRVNAMLDRVGLTAGTAERYPREFSGGQCQRIGIARAMILNPALLVCDEPVSSLDVSIQGQIINLLADMQREVGMAMLFVSHNLAVVRHLSHRVLVLFKGELVEAATTDLLFSAAVHPYTRALLAAATGDSTSGPGAPDTSMGNLGCVFRGRCVFAIAICSTTMPLLEELEPGHRVACHRARDSAILES